MQNKNYFKSFLGLMLILFFIGFVVASDFGEQLKGSNYEVSRDRIQREISIGQIFNDFVEIKNIGQSNMDVSGLVYGKASEIIEITNSSISIAPGESKKLYFIIKGKEGFYDGTFNLAGGVNVEIPILINCSDKDLNAPFLLDISPVKSKFELEKDVYFKVNINKLSKENLDKVYFNYTLLDSENKSYFLLSEEKGLNSSVTFVKNFVLPTEVFVGHYVLEVEASFGDFVLADKAQFAMRQNFFDIVILGFMPMWMLLSIIMFFILAFLTYYFIKKRIESKKKYKMSLDMKSLPKKDKENLFLGKIAETNHMCYYDPNKLTTHSIIAGATGGGKSITAQVLIEECLMKDIAVIVFDPTAQWSGMLRKCTDKKMMAYYPKFGLKPKDARGFKGNVKMIKNARQIIDLNKHVNPGQIQIFSLNKLDPSEMDIFVASIIRQIFKSDPKEYPGLKVLLVFDEVHRLLPKFGGNGEGFLQIERACREFRKWGLGVMLVSQVLNDFVGEIKANISTEIQMRTRDEGDLNRIKTKHGDEFLQSLVKASSGVGMFSNPAYNHAHPYFINFRPILHNTRRLTDEELDEYNKYNDQVDEIEFQVDELEKEKVDVFDLKMELKLIKDKIMSGSFSVVEIYLEGLKPRVLKEWEKLGKAVPELKIQLLSEEEIKAGINEAKSKHDDAQAKEDAAKSVEVEKKNEVILEEKIVASLTFDNGVMISSLKELKEYLPSMDSDVFKLHVNEEKNDIHKWVLEKFGEENGKKLAGKIVKDELMEALEPIGKKEEPKEDAKEEKKEKVEDAK